ncbi:MAG: sigma-70 family RNA polymerase sigma factor, partial [Methylobacteriaceae bacterium]|nr:sigma-70 family RNA polymerase sigma factor [Methylobacteriaceae bacterium]
MPHLQHAYRLARWMTGSAIDAEDVVQEASLRAFRSIRDCSGTNPRGWALAIVRNTANTWLTRNRRERVRPDQEDANGPTEDLDEDADTETPETALLRKATVEEVRRAVDALPSRFREVIVLREIEELDYREISEMVGIPLGTVMSRLSRARSMLFKTLG